MRPSGRKPQELRKVSFERGSSKHAEGSCLVRFGDTHVLCTATVEERVPPWLKGAGKGWVTAEYGMLPRATGERMRREAAQGKQSGRTQEIQRLIGRSLRAVVDLVALGERQITLDCDVIQADGGTRTAAITGSWIALHDALKWMDARDMFAKNGRYATMWRRSPAASTTAMSVLDLDYEEDSTRGDRCEFRDDRQRRHCRSAGHGGRRAFLRGALPRTPGARASTASATWWRCRKRRLQ